MREKKYPKSSVSKNDGSELPGISSKNFEITPKIIPKLNINAASK